MQNTIRFIDLFAGMGGFRIGFEKATKQLGIKTQCVFSSEIKKHAIQVYQDNFPASNLHGDITKISAEQIPDFDFLLAGFPCQAFSQAGKREGFLDTRGTLFFEIERILKAKKPTAFLLENVEGLVTHDRIDKSSNIGRTLDVMLKSLRSLGYNVTWKVLDSSNFGLAQSRKRVFLAGHMKKTISLDNFPIQKATLKDILEKNKPTLDTPLTRLLLKNFSPEELKGKAINDRRGGKNNIHSWEIEYRGPLTLEQKELMNLLMRARRNKKWAEIKGIAWMDGMPLTTQEISTFFPHPNLQKMLDDLEAKNYLRLEPPKDLIEIVDEQGRLKTVREYRPDLEKGYNIVAGKLSFEISRILDPNSIAPTLVAMDLDRLTVIDNGGIRQLTDTEQKRLFGFPDEFALNIKKSDTYDLFGNTVPIPVVTEIIKRMLTNEEPKSSKLQQPEQLSLI